MVSSYEMQIWACIDGSFCHFANGCALFSRFQVVGMFMRNWDEGEETGNQNCSIEADLKDAKAVCSKLGIPLQEVNFVAEYWNQVLAYQEAIIKISDSVCRRTYTAWERPGFYLGVQSAFLSSLK